LYCLAYIGLSVIFKYLLTQGVRVGEFTLFRNIANFIFVCFLAKFQNTPLVTAFPHDKKYTLLLRSIFGTAGFALYIYNLALIPMWLLLIIFQTNPFWSSVLAHFFTKDKVTVYEIIGMFICFAGVIMITVSGIVDDT